MCAALAALHERRIVHRDLKTLNVFLCREPSGVVNTVLGDLGVSRQLSQQTLLLRSFYGTPLYASPELCMGRSYTAKTDMWSLGVVLYEMAALEQPFFADNLMALAEVSAQHTAWYHMVPHGTAW
eukprot:PLAT12265.4.p2 GENE.PLAT12265.4~~PLAT12265.4.p2  ORF type:complete len:125 (+),score=20.44 PLAT12265.4:445-819(+)